MGRRAVGWMTGAVLVLGAACTRAPAPASGCGDPDPVAEHHLSLFAVDAETGALRWKHDDLPLYANLYTHLEGSSVIVSNGGSGQSFDIDTGVAGPPPPGTVPVPLSPGGTKVTDPVPSYLHPATALDGPIAAGSTTVIISGAGDGDHNGELVGYDAATGAQRWSFPLDRPSHSFPLVRDGVVMVTTGDELRSCG